MNNRIREHLPLLITCFLLYIQLGMVGCAIRADKREEVLSAVLEATTPPEAIQTPSVTPETVVPVLTDNARDIFRWKFQYVDRKQHGFPPSWRAKICVPITLSGDAGTLTLTLSNDTTSLVLSPYDSGEKPKYTDNGMAQFEPRSTMAEWASIMAGPVHVTLRNKEGETLMSIVKTNPRASYSGEVKAMVP